MLTTPFNPREEKEQLSEALNRLHQEWEHGLSFATVLALCDTAERADEVLTALQEQGALDRDTRLQVIQLKILLTAAKQALEAVQDEPLTPVNPYPVSEEQEPMLGTIFPAGTIIDCPECGEGLYKVTQEVSTAGIVLDDGAVLVLLNQTIPTRTAWSTVVCPLCGGRLLKDGKIHTLQHGWR